MRGPWREAVNARGQNALHACGQGCRYHCRVKVKFAGAGANYAPLAEEADDFLSEERITLSLLGYLPRERLGQSLDPGRARMRRRMSPIGSGSRSSLETTARSSQGGAYSGRRVVSSRSLSFASLSTILPSNSSDTLSIQ